MLDSQLGRQVADHSLAAGPDSVRAATLFERLLSLCSLLPTPSLSLIVEILMAVRKRPTSSIPVINQHAAGVDIGHDRHYVCVGDNIETDVRTFGSFTGDLDALIDWLVERSVTTVAMESTGVYWIPLFEMLERRGLDVILVDPRQTSRSGNRPKTDVHDCQWIWRLHAHGLLSGSFRPEDKICVLRSYLRQRLNLTKDAARCIQQMQKALDQMNLKLHLVVSDITGKTGLAIIEAILAGERDPVALAQFRDPRCKNSQETIAKALVGNWRDEHLFSLRQALQAWKFHQQQINECDKHLRKALKAMPQKRQAKKTKTATKGSKKNHPSALEVRELLAGIAGVDLTAIEGIDETIALTLIAELGVDLSAFPTEGHFASWLSVAPNPKKSGRRLHRSKTNPSANRAATAFRLAAQAVARSDSALGGFYRRLRGRIGAPKAITATAHKIARIFYRMLTKGAEYVKQGLDEYERQFRERKLRALQRTATELGYTMVLLTPTPAPTN